MIPAKFDYVRPSSLDEAVRALDQGGEDAKVIAGGQSLLPLLRLRLAYPDLLVDLGRLAADEPLPQSSRRRRGRCRASAGRPGGRRPTRGGKT